MKLSRCSSAPCIIILVLLVVACNSPAASPTAAPAKPVAPVTTTPPAPPARAAVSQTSAPAGKRAAAPTTVPTAAPGGAFPGGKVVLAQSGESIFLGAANIARVGNYYKYEGLDAQVSVLNRGSQAMAGLVGGSFQFFVGNWGDGINAIASGQQVVALMTVINEHSFNVVIQKDVAQRLGITYQSSEEAKIKALKGLKIGITTRGAAVDQFTRYLLKKYNLDPDRDVNLVSLGVDGLVPALASGQVDAYTFPSPATNTSVARGDAIWLFQGPAGDFKDLRPFPQNTVMVLKSFAEKNRAVVRATVRSLLRGFKLIKENPNEAQAMAQTLFPQVDAQTFGASWNTNLPAFRDPEIDQAGFDATVKLMKAVGSNVPSSVSFSQVYTPTFVREAKRDVGFK